MSSTLPIFIDKLSKVYKGKKGRRVEALQDVSLEISEGEVFGFLGPNGAGKSTTIKVLLGQILPTSGEAKLFGTSSRSSAARARVGYLPENPSFYDSLNACEYLTFVGQIFGMPPQKIVQETDRVLELMDLTAAAKRPMRSYSKGMVQRLGLAQTLLHDPDLYILDEPMSGLDPLGRALVKKIMHDLKARGKTVFFSTHVTADVEAVCDRVGIIVNGRLRAVNLVEEVMQDGVEGYHVHLLGERDLQCGNCKVVSKKSIGQVVYVPSESLRLFVNQIGDDFDIQLIEPVRKDLEAFFLDIVAGNNS